MRTSQSVFLVVMAAFVMAGCGGSSSSPKSDAGRDVSGTAGTSGQPGAGGAFGSGGSPGSSVGGSTGGGAGGAGVDGGGNPGDTSGGAGGSTGTGGTPAGDAASGDVAADAPRADAADAAIDSPSTAPDAPLDAGADVIFVIDGGPTVVACPNDVVTATCTSGNVCLRTSGEICACSAASHWFCPGVAVGADGGITVIDAAADAPATPTCGAGAMTGAICTTEGEICRIPGSIGCGCLMLGNSLRWLCR